METAAFSGHVAVVGAGAMGAGIAQVFAVSGRRVRLFDVSEAAVNRGLGAMASSLERIVRKGALTAEAAEAARRRVEGGADLPERLDGVNLVVEAVAEQRETKAALFRRLDAAAPPETIFASNTSSISITWLGAQTGRPDRVIGMHFFNPVPVMPLVEIVRGLATSDETHRRIAAETERLGKTAVTVQDAPGFVANRILMPMINEAAYCLMEGVAEAADIDQVMKLGAGHPMGPLALADLIGLDVCLSIMEVLHRDLGEDKYRPCPHLRRLVAAGRLGRKSGAGFFDYGA